MSFQGCSGCVLVADCQRRQRCEMREEEIRRERARRRDQDDAAKHAEQRDVEAENRAARRAIEARDVEAREKMAQDYARSQARIRKYRTAKEGLRVVLEDDPGRADLDSLRTASEKLEDMANSEEGVWN